MDVVDLLEGIRDFSELIQPISRADELIERSGMVRSQAEQSTPKSMNVQQPKKQHSGLRCIKCFELLVHDDEFLFGSGLKMTCRYAGGKLLTNPEVLKERHWDALHHRSGIV